MPKKQQNKKNTYGYRWIHQRLVISSGLFHFFWIDSGAVCWKLHAHCTLFICMCSWVKVTPRSDGLMGPSTTWSKQKERKKDHFCVCVCGVHGIKPVRLNGSFDSKCIRLETSHSYQSFTILINTSTGIIVDLNNLRFKWHNNSRHQTVK